MNYRTAFTSSTLGGKLKRFIDKFVPSQSPMLYAYHEPKKDGIRRLVGQEITFDSGDERAGVSELEATDYYS